MLLLYFNIYYAPHHNSLAITTLLLSANNGFSYECNICTHINLPSFFVILEIKHSSYAHSYIHLLLHPL